MSIATEKTKQNVLRRQLVRLEVKRHISADLVSLGDNLYRHSYGFAIAFKRLAVTTSDTLTRDSSYPPAAPGGGQIHYYVDEAAGNITINLGAGSPSSYSFVASVMLFLTQEQTVYAYETPTDSATTVREWQPRLSQPAVVRQTQRNILDGLITFDPTSLQILNADNALQPYLTADDSLYNGECMIWECLADTSPANVQRTFSGKVSGIGLAGRVLTVQAFDTFYDLQDRADFGLTGTGVTSLTALGPAADPTPYPGHSSRQRTLVMAPEAYYSTVNQASTNATPAKVVNDCLQSAGLASYDSTISTSTNRKWTLGLIFGSLPTQSFGAIQATFDTGAGIRFIRFASYANLVVGDTIAWTEAGTDYYGHIAHVGTFTHLSVSYNVMVGFSSLPHSTSSTMIPKKALGLFATGYSTTSNPLVALWQTRDYTITETASGDFTAVSITLVNNFEANHGAFATLNPGTNDLYWRPSTDETYTHGTTVRRILEAAGLSVDTASITAANTAATDDAAFSVPLRGSSGIGTYAELLVPIMRGMLAYLSAQADGEIAYRLFSAPSSTDDRDDDNVLADTLSAEVNYQDIATSFRFPNPHMPGGTSAVAAPSEERAAMALLHGVSTSQEIIHSIRVVSGAISRQDAIADILSRRRVTYGLRTSILDIDRSIGDDVRIESGQVLGGGGAVAAKVVSIAKAGDGVELGALDLDGL